MKPMVSFTVGLVTGGVCVFLVMHMRASPPEPISPVAGMVVPPSNHIAAQPAIPSEPQSPPVLPDAQPPPVATEVHFDTPVARLTPEFERLFREGMNPSQHVKFTQRPVVPESDAQIEDRWRQYYAGKPETTQYGMPEIECRSSQCEIRLVAAGTVSGEQYGRIMSGPSSGAYPGPPQSTGGGDLLVEGGVTAMVLYTRDRPKPASSVQK